jgi:hypothetical protein
LSNTSSPRTAPCDTCELNVQHAHEKSAGTRISWKFQPTDQVEGLDSNSSRCNHVSMASSNAVVATATMQRCVDARSEAMKRLHAWLSAALLSAALMGLAQASAVDSLSFAEYETGPKTCPSGKGCECVFASRHCVSRMQRLSLSFRQKCSIIYSFSDSTLFAHVACRY